MLGVWRELGGGLGSWGPATLASVLPVPCWVLRGPCHRLGLAPRGSVMHPQPRGKGFHIFHFAIFIYLALGVKVFFIFLFGGWGHPGRGALCWSLSYVRGMSCGAGPPVLWMQHWVPPLVTVSLHWHWLGLCKRLAGHLLAARSPWEVETPTAAG